MLDRVDPATATAGRGHSSSPRPGRAVACVALLFAGLLVAGCGSSSSGTATSTAAAKPPLTKAQFLAQGNAICTQGNKNLEGPEKALGTSPTEAQVVTFLKGPFKSEVQRQIDAIRALKAPTEDQAKVKHIFDLAQNELDHVTSDPKAFISASVSPFKEFETAAHAYGLTVCASESNG
jgi:hypothetical protein